jgi:hypothetical protein
MLRVSSRQYAKFGRIRTPVRVHSRRSFVDPELSLVGTVLRLDGIACVEDTRSVRDLHAHPFLYMRDESRL